MAFTVNEIVATRYHGQRNKGWIVDKLFLVWILQNNYTTMIADPMADLTGEGTPGQTNENALSHKEVFSPIVLQVNLQRIDRVRSVMGIASGCSAGILGLTGLQGLGGLFYSLLIFSSWVVRPSDNLFCLNEPQVVSSPFMYSFPCQYGPGR